MPLYVAYPNFITPYVFKNLPIRWYSMMYLVAFGLTYILFNYQRKKGKIKISDDETANLFFYTIAGLIIGARLFSALFYQGNFYYWKNPHLIFWPFANGKFVGLPGMSYHGGLVGAVVGAVLFCRRNKKSFLEIADLLVSAIPLGYTFGRLGNFINGELWGRVSTAKWAMIFPDAPHFSINYSWVREIATKLQIEFSSLQAINLPRHPSQIYEALFEGIFLWFFLWFIIRKRKKFHGYILSWYLASYAAVRFVIEYFREPDANLGFIIALGKNSENSAVFSSFLNISMGQIFSLVMLLCAILLFFIFKNIDRKQKR
jgi:phosphatidylglycerol:prolipoprotein diacylglycerol transferase